MRDAKIINLSTDGNIIAGYNNATINVNNSQIYNCSTTGSDKALFYIEKSTMNVEGCDIGGTIDGENITAMLNSFTGKAAIYNCGGTLNITSINKTTNIVSNTDRVVYETQHDLSLKQWLLFC